MATLLLAEIAGGQLSDMTARALTAALELGGPVDVLVAGQNVAAAAAAAAQLAGRGEGARRGRSVSTRMALPSRSRR